MSIHRRLRIGITIAHPRESDTVTTAYAIQQQNAIVLAQALLNGPHVASVSLVHLAGRHAPPAAPPAPGLPSLEVLCFNAAKDKLDLLIELGAPLSWEQCRYLKRRSTRVISYCCDLESVQAMKSALYVNPCYDDIWLTPQVAIAHQAYFEVVRRTPARPVPFIWSPAFIEARMSVLPHGGTYQARSGPSRLCVMAQEAHTGGGFDPQALLIAELAYRARPEAIALVRLNNAHRAAKEDMAFITLANQLDVVRQHRVLFLHPQDTASLLAHNTDIVIAHHADSALERLHLEVCWQGFPLVHNARLGADLGYYYEGHRLHTASQQVLNAIDTHAHHAEAYTQRQRARIARHLPGDPTLTQHYTRLLQALMRRPLRE